MYVNVYIAVKSPPLYFPPAGGKPRNIVSCKTMDVFSCPRRGDTEQSGEPQSARCPLVALRAVAAGRTERGLFFKPVLFKLDKQILL